MATKKKDRGRITVDLFGDKSRLKRLAKRHKMSSHSLAQKIMSEGIEMREQEVSK